MLGYSVETVDNIHFKYFKENYSDLSGSFKAAWDYEVDVLRGY